MYMYLSGYICIVICVYNSILLNLLLTFDRLLTEFFEPLYFYHCKAQLVIENSWTAEAQNWSISGIELIVCAKRTCV